MDGSFIAAVTIGFLGGVHCLGMCGGIVSAMSVSSQSTDKTSILTLNIFYNIGRISSYMLAGLIAGGLGLLVVKTSGGGEALFGLKIFAAVVLIALGLYLSGLLNLLAFTEKLGAKLWVYISPIAQKVYPFKTIPQAFTAGLLWGWIPCGLVYGVLAWSITSGSPLAGAWLMLGFGLGTFPNLLAMGIFAQKLKPILQNKKVKLFAGLSIVALGVFQIAMTFMKFDKMVTMHT